MAKGYAEKQKLYKEAYTHPSAGKRNYQRLELLGDRILNMVVMEMLYHAYPNENEGMLSQRMANLTSGATCALIAKKNGMQHEVVAANEAIARSDNTLSDVFEAFIGAIYLNDGFDVARAYIVKQWTPILHTGLKKDPKTQLQEYLQGRKMQNPVYRVDHKEGPDHKPSFRVSVTSGDKCAFGVGSSRKEAEHKAASFMLDALTKGQAWLLVRP